MNKCLIVLLLLVAAVAASILGRFVWQLHPWVRSGTALQLGKWHFGDYEIQVWQRKNSSTLEPFADGLFVRKGTNVWRAFCIDIQDSYLPKIELKESDGKVEVFRDGECRGYLVLATGSFRLGANLDEEFTPCSIGDYDQPPGDWWLGKPVPLEAAISSNGTNSPK